MTTVTEEETQPLEIQRAIREKMTLTLILIDLDSFKEINDSFGHQAGDFVLLEFANFLKTHFRGYDYLYRYSGEEFLILLPGTLYPTALEKAENLRKKIKMLGLQFEGKLLPQLTISAGISSYPESGLDALQLISAADIALYRAKTSGRDQVAEALQMEV